MAFLLLISPLSICGFSVVPNTSQRRHCDSRALFAARYGPPLEDLEKFQNNNNDEEEYLQSLGTEFRQLLDKVLNASKVEHIPSLLTKHTEVILKMQGDFAVQTIQGILEETHKKGGDAEVERVSEAIEMVLSFAEDFVGHSQTLDQHNKELLGKIMRTMTQEGGSDRDREEQLDEFIAKERDQFTRGFLRHLDGECERLASARKVTKESTRMKEILLIIKTRIVEELGKDLGEGALVLGQLVAYEDKQERMAVLDAGLTVRGIEFAVELGDLTDEALQGFQSVPGGADPTLIQRVEEIDERVKAFIAKNNNFQ